MCLALTQNILSFQTYFFTKRKSKRKSYKKKRFFAYKKNSNLSSAAGSAFSSTGGSFATSGLGQTLFATVAGGLTSSLQGGNFWEGAAIGLTVGLLNHAFHIEKPDNGYEKDGKGGYKKINDNGGDTTDYLYENGQVVASKSVATAEMTGSPVGHRSYGINLTPSSPGELVFDEVTTAVLSEIKLGYQYLRGLSIFGKTIPKTLLVQFGQNSNQISHVFRHTDALGLSRNIVQKSVLNHIKTVSSNIIIGKPFNQVINISGKQVQYTAYKLENGIINIGRIHGVN